MKQEPITMIVEIPMVSDMPSHLLKEIEPFFTVCKDLEAKKTAALGWHDLPETLEIIEASRRAHPG